MQAKNSTRSGQGTNIEEALSVLVFSAGIFLLASVLSFHLKDPMLFGVHGAAQNLCGRTGAWFASVLIQFFGLGAFLVPIAFFSLGVFMQRGGSPSRILGSATGLAVGAIAFGAFSSLQWKYWTLGGGMILTGGEIGTWLAQALLPSFNYWGSTLVSLLIFTLSLVICTPLRIMTILNQLFAKTIGAVPWKVLAKVLFDRVVRSTKWVLKAIVDQIGAAFHALIGGVTGWFSRSESVPAEVSAPVMPPAMSLGMGGAEAAENFDLDLSDADEDVEDLKGSEDGEPDKDQDEDERDEEDAIPASKKAATQGSKKNSGIKILPRERDTAAPAARASQRPSQGHWKLPTIEFLKNPPSTHSAVDRDRLIANSQILRQKFADFGIEGEVTAVRPGPVITLYEFKPGPGVKVSRIAALADDLSMALSAQSVRILAPLPGKSVVGIEIPSEVRETVYLREFLQHPDFYGPKLNIPVIMGKDIGGQTYLSDLARMPHLLCAGQTGSGKSVFMNGLICSLFYRFTPDELRMILVDPKFIEFRAYQDMPHLLLPVVDDPKQASIALRWAVREMDRRYRILAKMGARNLASFNQKVEEMGADVVKDLLYADDQLAESSTSVSARDGGDWAEAFEPDETGSPRIAKLPYIVVVIDELADLMMIAKKDVEISIARIAQKARAAGIHLIIATQRPSTDVVTGLIKANLPSRVSFQLASYVDSKTILDRAGAERLLGQGDMLFIPPGVSQSIRLHGAYLDDDEIHKITTFLRSQGKPAYRDEILIADDEDEDSQGEAGEKDELFDQGVELVRKSGQASASFLQRNLKIGYNRAARMIETMESRGIVGPPDGARPREVIQRL